jgi:hypothetical protein
MDNAMAMVASCVVVYPGTAFMPSHPQYSTPPKPIDAPGAHTCNPHTTHIKTELPRTPKSLTTRKQIKSTHTQRHKKRKENTKRNHQEKTPSGIELSSPS